MLSRRWIYMGVLALGLWLSVATPLQAEERTEDKASENQGRGGAQHIGQFTYYNDGSVAQDIGAFTYYNDGSSGQRIGNYTYNSDGTVVQHVGSFVLPLSGSNSSQ